jgi:hypothetical protein
MGTIGNEFIQSPGPGWLTWPGCQAQHITKEAKASPYLARKRPRVSYVSHLQSTTDELMEGLVSNVNRWWTVLRASLCYPQQTAYGPYLFVQICSGLGIE